MSALVHGGRSRGNDRNLRIQRRATTLVRNSEGQQPKIIFFKNSLQREDILVWAQAGQEQRWVATAGTRGEL